MGLPLLRRPAVKTFLKFLTVFLTATALAVPVNFGVWKNAAAGPVLSLLVTGQTPGTPRHDFNGQTGFSFTTGGASITVNQIGRLVWSGNTQTHVVSLYSIASTTPTLLGSVTVDTSGGTPGTYVYGTLSTPVVLAPSGVYAIFSQEVNGGDDWGDDDTTITVDTIITSYISAGIDDLAPGSIFTHLSSRSYGPVNAKFH